MLYKDNRLLKILFQPDLIFRAEKFQKIKGRLKNLNIYATAWCA